MEKERNPMGQLWSEYRIIPQLCQHIRDFHSNCISDPRCKDESENATNVCRQVSHLVHHHLNCLCYHQANHQVCRHSNHEVIHLVYHHFNLQCNHQWLHLAVHLQSQNQRKKEGSVKSMNQVILLFQNPPNLS